jgi:hypothetical protein
VRVQPFSTTLFGLPSPSHIPQGRRAWQLRTVAEGGSDCSSGHARKPRNTPEGEIRVQLQAKPGQAGASANFEDRSVCDAARPERQDTPPRGFHFPEMLSASSHGFRDARLSRKKKESQGCSEARRPRYPAPRVQSSGDVVSSRPRYRS